MSEQRKHIEVVAAIIKKNNTILATQRGYGDLKDGWEFPGGKVEPGEAHEVALKREIHEELEAEITVLEHIITVEYTGYEKFDLTMHCYLCSLVNDSDITLLEHEASKWLSKDTLYTVDWLPADIEAVDAISKRL
ncbi:(deoxy)nucleoside triphosphate pyrophosphohydrolase [Veillonella sp.]|uniref:(deoxy)nucleoside triphosphate pyrophosphohydrolase n=1 Tax=Veillonella sp. TaxID=1926307 RepID=UPI0025F46C98|nr:(deoxy)nucleoside triphosphate pyrophosphohydrolase [Veillonella sp.]